MIESKTWRDSPEEINTLEDKQRVQRREREVVDGVYIHLIIKRRRQRSFGGLRRNAERTMVIWTPEKEKIRKTTNLSFSCVVLKE